MPICLRSVSRQHLCRVSCGKVSNALNFWASIKVLAVAGDGASTNRKIFRMNSNPTDSSCNKTVNPYSSSGRFLYYISDPPSSLEDDAQLLVAFWFTWEYAQAMGE